MKLAGRRVTLAVAMTIALTAGAAAQLRPTQPGTAGDPVWQRTLVLSDGRTFISDGGLAIDAALAKPPSLPDVRLPPASAKLIEKFMATPLKDDFLASQLKPSPDGRTFAAPSGMLLNATYVKFLTRVLPVRTLRFRMQTEQEPIVVVSGDRPVAVLMAVKR